METMMLDTKKMEAFREILDIENETVLIDIIAFIHKTKNNGDQKIMPPEGFMTGDEFERRVKKELKQLYQEHGLL